MPTPEEQQPGVRSVQFYFRAAAHVFNVCFFTGLLVGVIATFALAGWDREYDKILRFYDQVNPCLFFDWWQAKVSVTPFWNLCMWVQVMYSLGLMHWLARWQASSGLLISAVLISGLAVLSNLSFMNVATTNLYPEHAFNRRALGHPFVENATTELTEADIDIVSMHSFWYIQWLFFQIINMIFIWTVAKFVNGYTSGAAFSGPFYRRVLMRVLYTIGLLGIWSTSCAMAYAIAHRNANWKLLPDLNTVASVVSMVHSALSPGVWHPIPVLTYQYLIRREAGVVYTVSLTPRPNARRVSPETCLSWILRVIVISFVHAYLFVDPSDVLSEDVSTYSQTVTTIAVSLYTPYSYAFNPLILGTGLAFAFVMALSLLRESAASESKASFYTSPMGICQIALALAICLTFLTIPEITFTEVPINTKVGLLCVAVSLIAIWLILQAVRQPYIRRNAQSIYAKGSDEKGAAESSTESDETPLAMLRRKYDSVSYGLFALVFVGLMIASAWSVGAVMATMVWLAMLDVVVPVSARTPLYVTVDILGDLEQAEDPQGIAMWCCGTCGGPRRAATTPV